MTDAHPAHYNITCNLSYDLIQNRSFGEYEGHAVYSEGTRTISFAVRLIKHEAYASHGRRIIERDLTFTSAYQRFDPPNDEKMISLDGWDAIAEIFKAQFSVANVNLSSTDEIKNRISSGRFFEISKDEIVFHFNELTLPIKKIHVINYDTGGYDDLIIPFPAIWSNGVQLTELEYRLVKSYGIEFCTENFKRFRVFSGELLKYEYMPTVPKSLLAGYTG